MQKEKENIANSNRKDLEAKSLADKNRHFPDPQGYFEALPGRVLARIDAYEKSKPREPAVKRWTKYWPSVYLAASFLLMIGLFKTVDYFESLESRTRLSSEANVRTRQSIAPMKSQSEDDYLDYLADHYTNLAQEEWWMSESAGDKY